MCDHKVRGRLGRIPVTITVEAEECPQCLRRELQKIEAQTLKVDELKLELATDIFQAHRVKYPLDPRETAAAVAWEDAERFFRHQLEVEAKEAAGAVNSGSDDQTKPSGGVLSTAGGEAPPQPADAPSAGPPV